jgi:flagellar motility protein MotE (MotC chaperone)
MKTAKKGMTREQAGQLYQDLQNTMAKMLKKETEYFSERGIPVPENPLQKLNSKQSSRKLQIPADLLSTSSGPTRATPGATFAMALIVLFAACKVIFSGLEYAGIASVNLADAAMNTKVVIPSMQSQYSREELQILKALDSRRAELEERSKRLDDKELDIARKDKEFAVRLTELRELNERINSEKEKSEHKRNNQLEQLANVYGSMNPEEAAKLIEQLDITIGISLLERMPEKRMGQILALMAPERALTITKMLSGRQKG